LRGFFSFLQQAPEQTEGGDGRGITQEEIDEANRQLFEHIKKLSEVRMEWANGMHPLMTRCFKTITYMSVAAFIIGFIIIIVPFLMFFASPSHDTDILWFSSLGVAETVAVLLYQPMQRVQKATSDMIQSTMILSSWATEIGLTLYLLKLKEIGMNAIEDKIQIISNTTRQHIKWLQKYIEAEPEGAASRQPGKQ